MFFEWVAKFETGFYFQNEFIVILVWCPGSETIQNKYIDSDEATRCMAVETRIVWD